MSSVAPAPGTATKPLSFMEKLGPLVFFYQPSEASRTDAAHHPRFIILSSWTDARDAHIAKYIAKYQVLYPAAQILLLRSTMDCIVRPSQIGPAMSAAASVLRAAFPSPVPSSSPPPLLIHIFSNGGSSSVANLYEQYAATAGPNDDKRLPAHVTVFDSCPGLFRLSGSVAFVGVGLPFFQQLIAAPFLYAFAAFWTAAMALGWLPNSLGNWYKSHNEDVGNSAEVRRVYIYSAADTLTDHKDVEMHATKARASGFSVALEKFEGSAHVAHLRKDETRYWDIVKRTVEG
jgi:pimeloyl-ACP methyl ester carboxylesterase